MNTTAVNGQIGTFTIDPATFTVASLGGDETGAQVGTQLATSNVTLSATNTLTINDSITWLSTSTLTLSTTAAGSTVGINQPISGVNGALAINTAGAMNMSGALTLHAASVSLSGGLNDTTGALTVHSTSGEILLQNVGSSTTPAVVDGLTLNSTGAVDIQGCYFTLPSGDFSATGTGYTSTTDANGAST